MVRIRRIYDTPSGADGFRVLVDRLWPRGISRERAKLGAWMKELAPSTTLRLWFHRDRGRWAEFQRRYRSELEAQTLALQALRERSRQEPLTLLYAARDPHMNHALVLQQFLLGAPSAAP